jgi:hypothetical protein
MDHSAQVTLVVLAMILLPGAIIAPIMAWLNHRRTVDVLKVYAERGQAPPAGVLDAVGQFGKPPQPPRPSRGERVAQFVGSLILAIGGAGVAWWLAQTPGTALFALFAAIFVVACLGGGVAQLVPALTARNGR